jgi:FkbM family methyltransferase
MDGQMTDSSDGSAADLRPRLILNRFPAPSYRVLFWIAMTGAAGAVGTCFHIVQSTRQLVGDPSFYDPSRLSALRDVKYPFTIEIYGYKYQGMTGEYIDDHILAFGAYEKDVLFFMRDYIRARNDPDAVFLDVGACEGQHSLFMSRLVKEVHAFEPFPPSARRCRELIELNRFNNIHLHEVGLGDRETMVPFHAPGDANQGGGRFLPPAERGATGSNQEFRVVVGDRWLEQRGVSHVELIKIDVEGYEQHVLAGLSAILARERPVVVLEVGQPPFGTIGSLQELGRLFPVGYRFLGIHPSEDGWMAITGRYQLTKIDRLFQGGALVMVVAYPQERGELIPRKG